MAKSMKKTSKKDTEAGLGARVHGALKKAFPGIREASIEHQTRFQIRLGHQELTVQGRAGTAKTGIADILVRHAGQPLCVLELKRHDLALTKDDVAQGLSYARLTTPITPLVVTTNGKDIWVHDTYTGRRRRSRTTSAKGLKARLAGVAKLAAGDADRAVATLMGTSPAVWARAINSITARLIEERTGDWSDFLKPFPRAFSIRRLAGHWMLKAFQSGAEAVVVHGPPISGKSNLLRQLALDIQGSSHGLLILEPTETGLFARIADLLSAQLNWNLSANDVREWLRDVSKGDGTAVLFVAVDGIAPSHKKVLADLDELSGSHYGPKLRLIATLDDSALDSVLRNNVGRELTAFGRTAATVSLQPLHDVEFEHAANQLRQRRIGMTLGSQYTAALREPAVLRALVPTRELAELPDDKDVVVRIPPLLDLRSLQLVRERFPNDEDGDASLRAAAEVILGYYLANGGRRPRPGLSTYQLPEAELESSISASHLATLRDRGFIKRGIDWDENSVWLFRVPVLVATYLMTALVRRMTAGEKISPSRFVAFSMSIPHGDLIVAGALVQWAQNGASEAFLETFHGLFAERPSASSLSRDSEIGFIIDEKLIRVAVRDLKLSDAELDNALTEPGGWIILSHVAGAGVHLSVGEALHRLDEPLMLEIAQCPFLLVTVDSVSSRLPMSHHDIAGGTVVCTHTGVVEPITLSLINYLIEMGAKAERWIQQAAATGSSALLSRLFLALQQVAGMTPPRGKWAARVLDSTVTPAFAKSLRKPKRKAKVRKTKSHK